MSFEDRRLPLPPLRHPVADRQAAEEKSSAARFFKNPELFRAPLLVEVGGVFLDGYRVYWARRYAAHAADAVLHVGDLDPVAGVLIDAPGADAHTRLAVDALFVVDGDPVQPSRLPTERRRRDINLHRMPSGE